ncbi:hypothetical protein AVEN_56510-1, partial [Araneus ventricosus]
MSQAAGTPMWQLGENVASSWYAHVTVGRECGKQLARPFDKASHFSGPLKYGDENLPN